MKILKPGTVEQRKFVCPKCECEFVADNTDKSYSLGYYVLCPHCKDKQWWDNSEPYEEPTPKGYLERLASVVCNVPQKRANSWPEAAEIVAEYLIANGVTFRDDAR